MSDTPSFPPLMQGIAVNPGEDPFERACAMAALGCDGGTVSYAVLANRLGAALVFAPEVTLEQAMAMLPVCGVGFQNALGALGPPEIAVHLNWDGTIRINGAVCGRLRVAAAGPAQAPDWLVVGLEVALMQTGATPGENPDVTSLYDEGCSEVDPVTLLESWARHSLVWINRWSEEGNAPLHKEWMGLVPNVGEEVTQSGKTGTFLGVDDLFGMLLRHDGGTDLISMSSLLEDDT